MKHFLLTNWYKLTTATAMLIFACALFIFSVKSNSVIAGDKPGYKHSENPPEHLWIVANNNGIFEVKWNSGLYRYECEKIFNESGR